MNVTFLRKLQTNKNTIRNRVNRAGMSLSMLIHRYRYVVVLGRFNNLTFSYIYIVRYTTKYLFLENAFILIIVYYFINNLPTCLVVKHGTQT